MASKHPIITAIVLDQDTFIAGPVEVPDVREHFRVVLLLDRDPLQPRPGRLPVGDGAEGGLAVADGGLLHHGHLARPLQRHQQVSPLRDPGGGDVQ